MVTTHASDALIAPLPIVPVGDTDQRRGVDSPVTSEPDVQQWLSAAAGRIIDAAAQRWPRFGPWRVGVTFRDDGCVEWKLQGRSWKSPDVGAKARIGATLEELEHRVIVDRDE